MIEMIFEQRNKKSVHLNCDLISYPSYSCLIIQHFKKDISLVVCDVRTCILDMEILAKG